MEGNKQQGSSPAFTSELFGSKEPSSSSTGIFGYIFAPSPKVVGREAIGRKQDPANGALNAKLGTSDGTSNSNEGGNQNVPNKDVSSIYQEQGVQPCHLSSSIYYGGQDTYNHPQSTRSSSLNSMFKKDETEDDTGSASRGNWWQGSLYY